MHRGQAKDRRHIMTNTALTGAAYDIDGGEHLVPA
jgi:hypothetical protein